MSMQDLADAESRAQTSDAPTGAPLPADASDSAGQRTLFWTDENATEASGHGRLLMLLSAQTELLGRISRAADGARVLSELVRIAQRLFEPSICALRLSPLGSHDPYTISAAALPAGLASILDRMVPCIAVSNGSACRDAAELPAPLAELAKTVGIQSFSLYPVLDGDGHSLGMFIFLFSVYRKNEPDDARVAATLVALARLAIESDRRLAAAARSSRELQEFASFASHDLQEPLRRIEASSEQLRRRPRDKLDDNVRHHLDRIETASRRMRTLIDALLSYSRVSTNLGPFVRCDLQKILAGVLSDLRHRIAEAGGKVVVGPLPAIAGDPAQVRLLFRNLVANALKFRRKDLPPLVQVSAGASEIRDGESATDSGNGGFCRIQVTDNGIGFDIKHADRIFGMFQKLHSRGKYEGAGIGLATCRRIVERHQGRLEVKSVPGEGSSFVVALPIWHAGDEANTLPAGEGR